MEPNEAEWLNEHRSSPLSRRSEKLHVSPDHLCYHMSVMSPDSFCCVTVVGHKCLAIVVAAHGPITVTGLVPLCYYNKYTFIKSDL